MKLAGKISPKNLFRSKKQTTVSRSDQSSFGSSITTSSGSPESTHYRKSKSSGVATPTSVLPTRSHDQSSGEFSEISGDLQYELIHAFRIMDSDGDGRITRSELAALLSRIGGSEPISPEELSLMLNETDTDGDGCISLQEFGKKFATDA
ncbi:hypothetical protein SSX86_030079 [Deinandra increscens subsp. villosa]|uniref:EF-hand domain-containing protein n=1 Tax=Deinandra increscens subsp. villosa TaxID=3103831 RepID=A0AAP0GN11_9ASTR